MSQLSPHFTLEEFSFSQTATRYGVRNDPSPEIITRLVMVAHQMEHIRSLFGNRPIRISSGYRSEEANALIGGANNSAHCQGYACDFTVSGLNVYDCCVDIRDSGIKFDQLINEAGQWIHLSFDPRMRQQVLTAKFKNGKATYSEGL